MTDCMLCAAERLTDLHYEDADVWVSDCVICMTPMVVWQVHGLPDPGLESRLLSHLEKVAEQRYGADGYYIDGERRRIPDHWHAHARPAGGFFDPKSTLFRPA